MPLTQHPAYLTADTADDGRFKPRVEIHKIAVFDIDGCCIDSSQRMSFWPHDVTSYYSRFDLDTGIAAGVLVYQALMDSGVYGLFITARGDKTREQTESQLARLFPTSAMRGDYKLLMSYEGDGITLDGGHALFKKTKLLSWLGSVNKSLNNVVVCFDDNTDVVETYRALGLTAYQTAKGWR